ncbi:MAG TPA: winged helix DNA-binding domain-containing protein [Candidatus Saccharimonadales bacterium]|nr:winged helix DNA-binding domain-containing protein [Candidatus Saccharimonadales bacterium]
MNITQSRLINQHLLGDKFVKPEEVVDNFGAVQAQDFPAAKYSLGIRIKNSTDQSVEHAFNEGKFLRTHVLRPTWHFVTPADLVWMQDLTRDKVKAQMAGYNRRLELTDEVFARATEVIVKELSRKNYKTRQELRTKLLDELKIETDVQRLAHLIMWPELDSIICSGPKIGKQLTYALVSERAPKSKKLSREESLAKLTWKYFSSHGPAQVIDFSWWSGLNQKEIVEGLDLNQDKLVSETIEGKTYWFSEKTKVETADQAHLLSIYDEYTIAYRDRSALGSERYIEKMIAQGNFLTSVIILNGLIVGYWKRNLKKDKVEVSLTFYRKINKKEKTLVELAAKDYADFLKLPLTLEFSYNSRA